MAFVDDRPAGPVYWIDHFVICTNEVERWEAFHRGVLGGQVVAEGQGGIPAFMGVFPFRSLAELMFESSATRIDEAGESFES